MFPSPSTRPTFEKAKSMCELRSGKLVEIESQIELEYLKRVSKNFWLGTKRNMENGVWMWESNKTKVNFKLWKMTNNVYGKTKDEVAFNKGNSFVATKADKRFSRGIDAICEAPTIHPHLNHPPPADSYPEMKWNKVVSHITNSTYLFSKSPLPWSMAQDLCQAKSGSLAVIESPKENEFLVSKLKSEARKVKSRWLGAFSRDDGQWRWNDSNDTFAKGYTDWKPNQAAVKNSACLLISGREAEGFFWERDSCISWHHFICEISAKDVARGSSSLDSANYLGDAECQENTYHFDGFATKVKSCFHFVKLQRSFEEAGKFCHEHYGETVAKLDKAEEKKFLPLIKGKLGGRKQVGHR